MFAFSSVVPLALACLCPCPCPLFAGTKYLYGVLTGLHLEVVVLLLSAISTCDTLVVSVVHFYEDRTCPTKNMFQPVTQREGKGNINRQGSLTIVTGAVISVPTCLTPEPRERTSFIIEIFFYVLSNILTILVSNASILG